MTTGPMEPGGASFRREGAGRFGARADSSERLTIDEVLLQFLAEQRERLSARTYRRYEQVVELLQDCLDGYAYQSLDEEEHRRWEEEFEKNEDGAFCRLFGPEKIAEYLGEFLDYFRCAR